MSVFIWPADLDGALGGLLEHLAPDLAPQPVSRLDDFEWPGTGHDTVVMVMAGETDRSEEGLTWLDAIGHDAEVNLVVVVDDSYLGTDTSRSRAAESGAAVAAVRSIAVVRGTSARANVVCIPEQFSAEGGELRGPLRHETDLSDVAEAIRFFAGPDGRYLSGQVLFVNGGRQLFSSHTS